MTKDKANAVGHAVVRKLLASMARSTFHDLYPEAYKELQKYELDMVLDTERVLLRQLKDVS